MSARGRLMSLGDRGKRGRWGRGQSLPAGVGWAGNGVWPAGGTLPNTAAPGLPPKASKLAKPPGEGVWPAGGGDVKVTQERLVHVHGGDPP